jgi:hypothetical protein
MILPLLFSTAFGCTLNNRLSDAFESPFAEGGGGEPSPVGGPFNPGTNLSSGESSGVLDYSKTVDYSTYVVF